MTKTTERPFRPTVGETIKLAYRFEIDWSATQTCRDVVVSGVGRAAEGTEILTWETTAPSRTSQTRVMIFVGGSSGVRVLLRRGRTEARRTKEEWSARRVIPVADVEERVARERGKVLRGERTSSVVSVESPNSSGYVDGKTDAPVNDSRNEESSPALSASQNVSQNYKNDRD